MTCARMRAGQKRETYLASGILFAADRKLTKRSVEASRLPAVGWRLATTMWSTIAQKEAATSIPSEVLSLAIHERPARPDRKVRLAPRVGSDRMARPASMARKVLPAWPDRPAPLARTAQPARTARWARSVHKDCKALPVPRARPERSVRSDCQVLRV